MAEGPSRDRTDRAPATARKTLTDRMVASFPKKQKRYPVPDPELRGHYIRVMPQGANVFVALARSPYGKQVWATIGAADMLKIEEARERARTAIRRIKEGKPALKSPPVQPESFEAVASAWMQRHMIKNGLRTAAEIERALAKYVVPYSAERPFAELRRSDAAALFDMIEDRHGPRMADVVRTHLGGMGAWFAERGDDYTNVFLRHRSRVPKGSGRRPSLTDDELRRIWTACEQSGAFGRFVPLLLLLGPRRGALVRMKWTAIDANGVWHMAREEREKGNAGSLRLPPLALEILRQQPRMAGNDYVFFARIRADGPTTSFVDGKQTLDKNSGVTGWTLHDCPQNRAQPNEPRWVPSEGAEAVLASSPRRRRRLCPL